MFEFLILIIVLVIIYKIYARKYFSSIKFKNIKNEVENYVNDCNQLNDHIENLRRTNFEVNYKNLGEATTVNNSKWNYKQKELSKMSSSPNVHNCSLSVLRNANRKPFQYLCKYFDIEKNEETIEVFENMLNNFEAVSEGREFLKNKKLEILKSINVEIPILIKIFSKKRLEKELGFETVDFSDVHFPKYKFQYVSDGGNKSESVDIIFNPSNIENFIYYLNEHIKWQKSIKGQRALMTTNLRNEIKQRDDYTCCSCGNSIKKEPNLLLEIDHIVPLSKGGMTERSNLQTLCWRCNRTKGSKIIN